jgi:hypothetical protein
MNDEREAACLSFIIHPYGIHHFFFNPDNLCPSCFSSALIGLAIRFCYLAPCALLALEFMA